MAGDEQPFQRPEAPRSSGGAEFVRLDPRCLQAERDPTDKERQHGQHGPAGQALLLPGHDEQDRRRQGRRGGLGQERSDEEQERGGVEEASTHAALGAGFRAALGAAFSVPLGVMPGLGPQEAQEERGRREVAEPRKDVLALGDPGDRFHLDRMERKKARGQERSRHRQAAQQAPQQEGAEPVQQGVDEVISRGALPPQRALDVVGREDERVVLRRGRAVRPDPRQRMRRLERRVVVDVRVVVPDVTGAHRRDV